MVCNRCTYVLEQELTALGFEVLDIKLGQAIIKDMSCPKIALHKKV